MPFPAPMKKSTETSVNLTTSDQLKRVIEVILGAPDDSSRKLDDLISTSRNLSEDQIDNNNLRRLNELRILRYHFHLPLE